MEYPSIFSPLTVKSMTVKNRIAMLPMGSNMGGEFGNITDDHIRYYEQRAKGGTGLIIVENACVYKQGLNGTTQIRIDKDRYIPGFSRLVERIHERLPADRGHIADDRRAGEILLMCLKRVDDRGAGDDDDVLLLLIRGG